VQTTSSCPTATAAFSRPSVPAEAGGLAARSFLEQFNADPEKYAAFGKYSANVKTVAELHFTPIFGQR
jgi:hypothetical protein